MEIIPDLSNEAYHNSPQYADYISSTELKKYMISPRAFKHAQDNPEEEKTPAMEFGSLFHSLMQSFADNYGDRAKALREWCNSVAVFKAPINPKTNQPYGAATKAYAEAYAEFSANSVGKTIASGSDMSLCLAMAESVLTACGRTSEQIAKLMKWSNATEVSYFCECDNGVKLKIRPDLLTPKKLVDWKTCSLESLDEQSVAAQIIKYRYDVSMAMYQHVLHHAHGKWYTPMLVFISKTAPHDCVIVDMSEWCYNYDKGYDVVTRGVGAIEFERLLKLHAECTEKNEWPGAEHALKDTDDGILKPAVPYWFGKKYFEE